MVQLTMGDRRIRDAVRANQTEIQRLRDDGNSRLTREIRAVQRYICVIQQKDATPEAESAARDELKSAIESSDERRIFRGGRS